MRHLPFELSSSVRPSRPRSYGPGAVVAAFVLALIAFAGCMPPVSDTTAGVDCGPTELASDGRCVCASGFTSAASGCTDIDECLVGNGGCAKDATCTNTLGSFLCACPPGSTGDGVHCTKNDAKCGGQNCPAHATCRSGACACDRGYEGATCTDVDECSCGTANEDAAGCALAGLSGKSACGAHRACVNSAGGFSCGACDHGFELVDGACKPTAACGSVACGAHATCSNTDVPADGTCVCDVGYHATDAAEGGPCAPIDPCSDGSARCDAHATCSFTGPGTYACTCTTGWHGDGASCADVDECATANGGCGGGNSAAAACTNTQGSFTCSCRDGFTGNGTTCTDVDECSTPCTGGSAHCNDCTTAHKTVCLDEIGSHSCGCDYGYQADGHGGCVLVPECGGVTCGANARCSDIAFPIDGTCTCAPGYAGATAATGGDCVDVNECLVNNGGCDAHATCGNTPGSHTCTCATGYAGTHGTFADTVCQDVDECLVNNGGCDANATCSNTAGSHTCTCAAGFTASHGSSPDTVCADVDECLVNNGGCDAHATCGNTPGSHTCTCAGGYAPSNGTSPSTVCTVINRCTDGTNNCTATHATCTFVGPGTFSCGCAAGYSGDGLSSGAGCADVNECLTANGGCDPHATCGNTEGGHTCTCAAGFTATSGTSPSTVCNDVNECLVAEGGCAPTTVCTNNVGGFTCEPRIIRVNDTSDTVADDGKCTLREAILAADTDTRSGATPGECVAGYQSDTIEIPAGTYAFSGAPLNIASTIVITGAGVASTTLSGGALAVTTGTVTFADLSINTSSFTTSATGMVTFSSSTGGTSTLTATGAVTNEGAIQAGKLTVTAASITNTAGATIASTLTLAMTATGTFLNQGAVDASGDFTLSALVLRNEVAGGDTREWYRSFTGSDSHDSTNAYYSFPDNYEVQYWSKVWTDSQRYAGGAPPARPQLTSGGVLTLQDFTTGTNIGSLVSAPTVTLIGNLGATFSNVDMALHRNDYRQTWEIYTHWIALGPATYDDHVRRNDDGGILQSTSEISNLGAGVLATTLNAGGFAL